MKNVLTASMILGALMFLAAPAVADWDEGDPHKMHYPQLPDPYGWDVNFSYYGWDDPMVLADDWRCSETGPVSDIHFWLSVRFDWLFDAFTIHASIHSDDLSNPDFSQPGDLLWEADFDMAHFTLRDYGTGEQGWYDPNPPETVVPFDHTRFYQVNIVDIPDPFIQHEGKVYWLDLTVKIVGLGFLDYGWKTSQDHFRDAAVWSDVGSAAGWQPLHDPQTGERLDLAFVITPEPSAVAMLLGVGLMGLVGFARRTRRR